jgi:c(7)-type cytochrome triheme protein
MALLKTFFRNTVLLIPLLIVAALPCAYAQEEELTLNNPDSYDAKQRPGVVFPHEIHMGEHECLECHHDYDEIGENVLDEDTLEEGNEDLLCASCHDSGTDVNLKKAYHRQCIGCHRELRRSGEATAPELCGECHQK